MGARRSQLRAGDRGAPSERPRTPAPRRCVPRSPGRGARQEAWGALPVEERCQRRPSLPSARRVARPCRKPSRRQIPFSSITSSRSRRGQHRPHRTIRHRHPRGGRASPYLRSPHWHDGHDGALWKAWRANLAALKQPPASQAIAQFVLRSAGRIASASAVLIVDHHVIAVGPTVFLGDFAACGTKHDDCAASPGSFTAASPLTPCATTRFCTMS